MFYFITYTILLGLTFLCFWLPYKSGNKRTGIVTSVVLLLVMLMDMIWKLEFLSVFLYVFFIAFCLVFIVYWSFYFFKWRKTAAVASVLLVLLLVFLASEPWIEDMKFDKYEAIRILNENGCYFNDEITLLHNESGGLRDYYRTFVISLSDNDYESIKQSIRQNENFLGKSDEGWYQRRSPNETLLYETDGYYIKDYVSEKKMEDSTFHFVIKLSKEVKELTFIASDE